MTPKKKKKKKTFEKRTVFFHPESGSAIRKNAGSGSVSGSALNQCGSETPLRKYAASDPELTHIEIR